MTIAFMKTRESGMPDEAMWESFFDQSTILAQLGLQPDTQAVVEFGCGYGTFTIPAARLARGPVYAFDIEPGMVAIVRCKAQQAGLSTIACAIRDFVEQGTGLPDTSVEYVMLFNLLHAECPDVYYDPSRPVTGNSAPARAMPGLAEAVDFQLRQPGVVNLPPYHYGLALERTHGDACP